MHVFDQASSCYDRWGKAIDRGFYTDGAFPRWLGYNQKAIRLLSLLDGAGALLNGDGALLDGDEAVSRWRRSSLTVALLESQTGCVDPRYKRKEPQSSEPQSRAIQHAWKELRNDQKWCGLKSEGIAKRRKCQEGSQSESSAANETRTDEEERPPGVKAAKGKKTKVEGKDRISEFQTMWSIKQQDLVIKERLSKMRLLDSLLAKKEPLADYEEALKKKLINELLSSYWTLCNSRIMSWTVLQLSSLLSVTDQQRNLGIILLFVTDCD
uniref:No apical meristem-associated C-terminal domain-containing protein n=1 Tax=Brassica oleracea var. oleracea TaxID=109376 RepID=A0A0D3BGD8_BRAOL